MDRQRCGGKGCSGVIEDGYCNVCGLAAEKRAAPVASVNSSGRNVNGASRSQSVVTGIGSSPVSRAAHGSRRTRHSTSRTTRRQLGAGLIALPELPSTDPEKMIMPEPRVPENKRFCPNCNAALRRESGFCGKCGQKYSFLPTLKAGDLVAGQYEVKGAIAYGGLGWIYLAFDQRLSRYVVLKGLLNAHDASSAATAVAERQFLAAVKHPNIVGIYNFVQQANEGFIVMEYVGGKTLKQIRQERGQLPPAEAIAYIHRILPAFSYLHDAGLVYCDFKPDNVMLERDDVKLIDMGGVRRIDDPGGDIYGTTGYSAPEASEGPTVASDLFTVGRALAVLITDIRGFSSDHKYTLPSPDEAPVFAQQESLYRFLLKATAQNPDDRFESADEMAEQLLGVLREIVARETGIPRPAPSVLFGGDVLSFESGDEMKPVNPYYRYVPIPAIDSSDPGLQMVSAAIALPDLGKRAAALRLACQQFKKSREVRLKLAATLIDNGETAEADGILKMLGEEDPWDWRVQWYRGRMNLATRNPKEAQRNFDQVYFDLPGEIAPKLALGLAAELAGNLDLAIHMYDIVSRVDNSYVSAAFGLSRCLLNKGDRNGAVQALDRVPQNSGLYLRSRVAAAQALISVNGTVPVAADLGRASVLTEGLGPNGLSRIQLSSQIMHTALELMCQRKLSPNGSIRVLGCKLTEKDLRLGLERTLRSMAQLVTGNERIRLIDQANTVRPRTLF
jgi:serine/threonine-protein kinase PknG